MYNLRCDSFLSTLEGVKNKTAIFSHNKNTQNILKLSQNPNWRFYNDIEIKYIIDFSLDHTSKSQVKTKIETEYPSIEIVTTPERVEEILSDIDLVVFGSIGWYIENIDFTNLKTERPDLVDLDHTQLTMQNVYDNMQIELDRLFLSESQNKIRSAWIWRTEFQRYVYKFFHDYFMNNNKKIYNMSDIYAFNKNEYEYIYENMNYPSNYFSNSRYYQNEINDASLSNLNLDETKKLIFVFGTDWAVGKQSYCIHKWNEDPVNRSIFLYHNYDIYGFKCIPILSAGASDFGTTEEAFLKGKVMIESGIAELTNYYNEVYISTVGRIEMYINKYRSQEERFWKRIEDHPDEDDANINKNSKYKNRALPDEFFNNNITKEYVLIKKIDEDTTEHEQAFFDVFRVNFTHVISKDPKIDFGDMTV